MKRAAILIGVQEPQNLPTLHAVNDGVARVESWALAQGMHPNLNGKGTLLILQAGGGFWVDGQDKPSVTAAWIVRGV